MARATLTSQDSQKKLSRESNQPCQKTPCWSLLVGTLLCVGFIEPGPGTWGSAIGVLVWFLVPKATPSAWHVPLAIGAAVMVTNIGIPAATRVERATGKVDPSCVIVDEAAGQLFALIGSPLAWKPVLAGFVLFRIFDILKLFPLRCLERLRGGLGIMMDDVGAGFYSLIALQLLLHFHIVR